jgi:putative ABC transport system permease protein
VFKVALKGVLARKGRVLTTAIAVMLGVAFVIGTLVLSDTITRVFNDLFADVNEGTDAVVRAESQFSDDFGTEIRGRIDAGVLPLALGTDGVADAEGQVQGFAQFVDEDGEPIGNPGQGAPTLGFSWPEIEDLNPFRIAEGERPRGASQVAMDRGTADKADFEVGDTVEVLTQNGHEEFELTAIVTFGTADSPAGASVALFDIAAAQRLIAEPGKFDAVVVVAEDGVSEEEVRANLEAAVAGEEGLVGQDSIEVLTGNEITEETQDAISDQLGFFTTFLLVFAIVALVVGAFVIYNTFGILVAQRGRELALLRAIGASRRQVVRSVLIEAVFVGAVGSLTGLGLGVVLAAVLRYLLNLAGLDIPTASLVVTGGTILISLALGMFVTVVAAVLPAFRASRVPPVAAMRAVSVDTAGRSRVRMLAGALITVVGGLLLAQGLFGGGDNALVAVGVGAGLVFVGVTVLGPVVAPPFLRVIGAPVARVRGMTGRLARENTLRNPKRTSSAAAALMIGVGLVGLITIIAASVTRSIEEIIDDQFTGDFVVDSGTFGFGGLSPDLADQLNELPEVRAATGIRLAFGRIDDEGTPILGVDPETAFDIVDVGVVAGDPQDLDVDGIAVHEDQAEDLGLSVGDPLPVVFAETGAQSMQVEVIYTEDQMAGPYMIGRAAYEANIADQFDFQVFILKSDDATTEEARVAIEGVADPFANAEVQDLSEYKASQTDQISQLVTIVYVLLMLAVIIALFGIGNTIALSIIERTRELGLLRAVGMTRRQLRSTVRWEAVLTSVFGTVLGLGIGLFFGWAIVEALKDEGLTAFEVPVGQLVVIVVIAALAGVLAAILPARRAAKLNILDAIAED